MGFWKMPAPAQLPEPRARSLVRIRVMAIGAQHADDMSTKTLAKRWAAVESSGLLSLSSPKGRAAGAAVLEVQLLHALGFAGERGSEPVRIRRPPESLRRTVR